MKCKFFEPARDENGKAICNPSCTLSEKDLIYRCPGYQFHMAFCPHGYKLGYLFENEE